MCFVELIDDQTLIKSLSSLKDGEYKKTSDDALLEEIMESGKNDQVDTAINYLQRVLETGSNLEHKLNPMQLKQK